MSSSMAVGLALLSRAAAGVRPMPSGAPIINCFQFSLSRSSSLLGSGGAGSGELSVCDRVPVVSAGAGSVGFNVLDGAGAGGNGSGVTAGSDLTVDCLADGGVDTFTGCLVSACSASSPFSSNEGRVQSTSASSRGKVE